MFIYIVINEVNYPIGTFVDINEARKYKSKNVDYTMIKSTLVGYLPSLGQKLKDKIGVDNIRKDLPDECKEIFGMKF